MEFTVCSLCADGGFLWVSPTIHNHTGQGNWRRCDGLAICPGGCPAYDPGKPPASRPYIGQALGKMNGIDAWMDVL